MAVVGFFIYRNSELSLDPSLQRGFAGHNPWLGAASPAVIVHEYFDYECPHCLSAHRKLRRKLSKYPEALRIVRHDYARMACAPNDSVRRLERCLMARAAHCAGKQNKYWEWNDAVIRNPKTITSVGYELSLAKQFGFDPASFDECLYSQDTIAAMDAVFRETREQGIRATPAYVVDGERLNHEQVLNLIEASMR